jgi:hypothetical protein
MKEDIYDDEFDPDLWNSNDKQDQTEMFNTSFVEHGDRLLDLYKKEGPFLLDSRFDTVMNLCVRHCARTDIVPVSFDLSFYQEEGWTNGLGNQFRQSKNDVASIFNLFALGLMEKFEIVAWYPRPHQKGSWAVRATCSFAVLTSLGFDFMRACLREKVRGSPNPGKKKTSKNASLKSL